ncbi:unnamed protein product [Paramecium octaurelia]|uniref:protein-tyrosine-phosphatase n=1 Tax=Paramecium octaurelia TaxID=43137 RepID=A0A8S1X7S5_PAROT|nr:unnamed protein product [Paramecium octaurelia]
MSEIVPHVYLSSIVYAKDLYWLKKQKISNILIIGQLQKYFPLKFQYKCILIEDKPENDISQYFEECIQYIDQVVAQNKNILVHCYGGQSRSVSIIIAYVMRKLSIDAEKAFNYVKERHPRAEPNHGFLNQLKTFK